MAQHKTYAVRPAVRNGPTFPHVDREHLLSRYEAELKCGSQCHPRIQHIYQGHAVFLAVFYFQCNPKTKIAYNVVCKVPLTDPVLQKDRAIDYLYMSEALPYAQFTPHGYYNNQGQGVADLQY